MKMRFNARACENDVNGRDHKTLRDFKLSKKNGLWYAITGNLIEMFAEELPY